MQIRETRESPRLGLQLRVTKQLGDFQVGLVGKVVAIGKRPNGVAFTDVQFSDNRRLSMTDNMFYNNTADIAT